MPTSPDHELETRIIAILEEPAAPGELASDVFQRKEDALWNLFTTVPAVAAFSLHRRLTIAHPDDDLSNRFQRMVVDRRNRLLDYLGDPRRRAALEASQR